MKFNLNTLDAEDPLAAIQSQFLLPQGTIYLDGNSLGMMPLSVKSRIKDVTEQQWAVDLITSWNKHQWIDLPVNVGERIAKLIGAAPGQTLCCDTISVNLFKLLAAALVMQQGRNKVVSTTDNFPTDLYMVQGLEDLLGQTRCQLQLVEESQLASAIDDDTAILLVTEVNFRTGQKLDIAALTAKAHKHGALVIVDLAHSAGVLPVALDDWQVDFAVGCTYKYLNGGPGAPAFAYVATRHQEAMQQPLYGWMGHANGFQFDVNYQAAADARQLLVGTPSVIAMSAVDAALDVYDQVTMTQIRQKSMQLTEVFLALLSASPDCAQLRCISPESPEQRGSQLSFEFEHAWGLCQALIKSNIIADFRAPNYIRFGFAPLYNSYRQIGTAVAEMAQIMAEKRYLNPEFQVKNKVT
ncbi:kynureninase [Planctobacterium marinum]|uniref:kynureninase n=1 Tax=Planctobacterium marinum TaxID=1631968 RepID=UPI001E3ED8A6|nr:kynureninase [Planctobacterium marinum]MCC2605899.1 kynureninase [Planctobacterium marinum]